MKIIKFGTAALIAFIGCSLKVIISILNLFDFRVITPVINTITDIISYSMVGYFFIMLYLKIGWKIKWEQKDKDNK